MLIYPKDPRPAIVETAIVLKSDLEIYPDESRPTTVDVNVLFSVSVEIYPAEPEPTVRVDIIIGLNISYILLKYPDEPKPNVVETRAFRAIGFIVL